MTNRCRQYLFLGGNGFIGATTVECVLARCGELKMRNSVTGIKAEAKATLSVKFIKCEKMVSSASNRVSNTNDQDNSAPDSVKFCIVTANRGKSWDWDRNEKVKPFVKHLHCHRKKPLTESPELLSYVQSIDYIDAVIDFSAYSDFEVIEMLNLVDSKVGLYVYVSSDSVYEVCEKHHAGKTNEEDATRPKDEAMAKNMNRMDSYGHKKLKGEEALKAHQMNGGDVPFIILRLADVIGEQDSTGRWWECQLWLELAAAHQLPVFLPQEYRDKEISLVDVKDVAKIITKLVNPCGSPLTEISGEAFNLAAKETVVLSELMGNMQSEMNTKAVTFIHSPNAPVYYPSVEKGHVDISKATSMLGWEPAPLSSSIARIVRFYKSVTRNKKWIKETSECIDDMIESVEDLYEDKDITQLSKALCDELSNV